METAEQLKKYLDLGFDVAGVDLPDGDGVLVLPGLPFDQIIVRLTLPGVRRPASSIATSRIPPGTTPSTRTCPATGRT